MVRRGRGLTLFQKKKKLIGTPHIEARVGDIAETVFLPGDPLRAKAIADQFLTRVEQFNGVRNMLGFTGFFGEKRVSVMGTGMGIPSMAIYSHELIRVFGAKKLIRIGTAGSLQERVGLHDVVIAQAASTNSSFARQFGLDGDFAAVSDFGLLRKAAQKADELGLKHHVGNVLSSDVFYHFDPDYWKKWQKMGALCIEMEAFALFANAANLGAAALAINTISDSLVTGEHLSAQARQRGFADVMAVALALI